jgi:hypothetical protein
MPTSRQPRQPPVGDSSSPGEPPSPTSHEPGVTHRALIQVSDHLRPRDLVLARLLADHHVLTSDQITAILFTSATTAVHRLRLLRRIGFLDRFIHRRPGRPPLTCWVPGLLSARYTALAAGQTPPTPRAVRHLQDRTLANPQLDHLLGVNQFFSDLIAHTRTTPDTRLIRWWSTEWVAAAFAGRIHPDGHGLWQTHGDTVGYWLEHDTGTEPLGRLVAKLGPYARLQHAGGPRYPVLFWLPSRRRETNLHALLRDTPPPGDVIVATGVHDHGNGTPGDAVWLLATASDRHARAMRTGTPDHGCEGDRCRMEDLPHRSGPAGPLNPLPTADDDPLHT